MLSHTFSIFRNIFSLHIFCYLSSLGYLNDYFCFESRRLLNPSLLILSEYFGPSVAKELCAITWVDGGPPSSTADSMCSDGAQIHAISLKLSRVLKPCPWMCKSKNISPSLIIPIPLGISVRRLLSTPVMLRGSHKIERFSGPFRAFEMTKLKIRRCFVL